MASGNSDGWELFIQGVSFKLTRIAIWVRGMASPYPTTVSTQWKHRGEATIMSRLQTVVREGKQRQVFISNKWRCRKSVYFILAKTRWRKEVIWCDWQSPSIWVIKLVGETIIRLENLLQKQYYSFKTYCKNSILFRKTTAETLFRFENRLQMPYFGY